MENMTSLANIKRLTDKEFEQISEYITSNYGIRLPPVKKVMVESRLARRLAVKGVGTFREYLDLVFSGKESEEELLNMIDAITTNKTDFFREPAHFDFMKEVILPEASAIGLAATEFKIWSAACSTGEEPYSICMAIEEFGFKRPYKIWASDLSIKVLKTAASAIYANDKIKTLPFDLKQKYWLKSKDPKIAESKVIKQLRDKVYFFRHNLLEPPTDIHQQFDVIFCRNVLIYFDRNTQEQVLRHLTDRLKPNGYLLIGHSESITQMSLPVKQIKPATFIKNAF